MPIFLDHQTDETICRCDTCGIEARTARANGVSAPGWGTGQLWIDISLSSQVQRPLCFCETCFADIFLVPARLTLALAPGEQDTP